MPVYINYPILTLLRLLVKLTLVELARLANTLRSTFLPEFLGGCRVVDQLDCSGVVYVVASSETTVDIGGRVMSGERF